MANNESFVNNEVNLVNSIEFSVEHTRKFEDAFNVLTKLLPSGNEAFFEQLKIVLRLVEDGELEVVKMTVNNINVSINKLNETITVGFKDLGDHINSVKTELKGDINSVKTELKEVDNRLRQVEINTAATTSFWSWLKKVVLFFVPFKN